MKKVILAMCILAMALCLIACVEKTDNINIEDFSKNHSVMYKESKYIAYYCDFDDGVLTVSINTYKDNPSSPSGVSLADKETVTFNYTLEGDNYITIGDVTYYYRAYKQAEYEHYVEFSTPFLGIAKKWKG